MKSIILLFILGCTALADSNDWASCADSILYTGIDIVALLKYAEDGILYTVIPDIDNIHAKCDSPQSNKW